MTTAHSTEGKLYSRQVDAAGAVHAYDGEQDLHADEMHVILRPAAPVSSASHARPKSAKDNSENAAVELEKLTASGNVQVVNKEGSQATGTELIVTNDDGANHVRLTARRWRPSSTRKERGHRAIDHRRPQGGKGKHHRPGNMRVLQEQNDGSKARPMDVAWIDRADMDGPGNRIDVIAT